MYRLLILKHRRRATSLDDRRFATKHRRADRSSVHENVFSFMVAFGDIGDRARTKVIKGTAEKRGAKNDACSSLVNSVKTFNCFRVFGVFDAPWNDRTGNPTLSHVRGIRLFYRTCFGILLYRSADTGSKYRMHQGLQLSMLTKWVSDVSISSKTNEKYYL